MDNFTYEGRNQRGELIKGKIESPNQQAVAQWMLGTGITPVMIRPIPQAKPQPQWLQQLG